VQRVFADFDDFWTTSLSGPVAAMVAKIAPADIERIKSRLRAKLTTDAAGRITCDARANAVKGRVPA